MRISQGEVLAQSYRSDSGKFSFEVLVDPAIRAPTEVFLPADSFGTDPAMIVDGMNDSSWTLVDEIASLSVVAPTG
jgi:hypothetical protein